MQHRNLCFLRPRLGYLTTGMQRLLNTPPVQRTSERIQREEERVRVIPTTQIRMVDGKLQIGCLIYNCQYSYLVTPQAQFHRT